MKKIVAAGIILASVSAFAYMDAPGQRSHMPYFPYEQLDLNAEQVKQIKQIRKEARNERIKLMDQMQDLRDDTRTRMMAVLTPEQQQQLKSMRGNMRPSMRDCDCPKR